MSDTAPVGAPQLPPATRASAALAARHDTDYIFGFWSAFGWTVLTFGVYGLYVLYQLMRRMRDHNRRKLEMLDALNVFAWEEANRRGLQDGLRSSFERVAGHLQVLRNMTNDFRDPVIWVVLYAITGLAGVIAAIFLDQDLVKHTAAESAAEEELRGIFDSLGMPVTLPPRTERKSGPHNYVGRIIASIFTGGIYALWWEYNLMTDANEHFLSDWTREDAFAAATLTN